ncbi:LptF/LptG family permease [Tamlana sp. 2_MG-2023]|uniref:LptF/LptG family permease n=1 Tax=unclassified Tamlana TaxID=2614803 RepID=UPI0026E1CC8B|nr:MULTISPECIES: LptF/LptG family permease [unclassified Tamlana]MDO6759131.1 LptF/LptG family permease [Tamlana sp. 2_MG-2023]MDO6789830.1 LptF/LptG family permease [Tamlana sp. 1_MG-2023]
MKILDRYILTSYLKTFISVFLILMMIFVLQTIWLYIKELAGKDLDIMVIVKFLFYFMPKLIPLVVPLTILLASIMVFGSFAENYEFAAMKSTGISLQRAMSGLSIFIVALGIVTFFFSNNVIPWAEYNSYNLRRNIAKLKPAMLLAEGQFNEMGDYTIKFDKKHGERDQFLDNVTIHIKGADGKTNATVIKAKLGELTSKEDSNVLTLILTDGHYYNDVKPKTHKARLKKPFVKSNFDKKLLNIDLSELNNVDFDEKSQTDKYSMLDVPGLNKAIDSLVKKSETDYQAFSKNLYQRTGFMRYNELPKTATKDSIYKGEILDLYDTKDKIKLVEITSNALTSSQKILTTKEKTLKASETWFNKHVISLHEKFALGFACVILFFVGAPLGALIRKGGIGLPMVIAILLFLTYHFIGIFSTNSAKSGGFNPILGSWFSTLVMLPLGIFLTKRATEDRGLFESQGILEPLKKLFGLKIKPLEKDLSTFDIETEEYATLLSYDKVKLIDIIKNYKHYNYDIKYKNSALAILDSRGVTKQHLKFSGEYSDERFDETIRLKNTCDEDSKLALILYIVCAPLILIGKILENNKYEASGKILFTVGVIVGVVYFIAFTRSFISFSNFKKHVKKQNISNSILYVLVGLPLFFVVYIVQNRMLKTDLAEDEIHNPLIEVKKQDAAICIKLKNIFKSYTTHAKFAIILYGIGIVLVILYFILKNNKQQDLANSAIQLSIISFILFIFYFIKSIINTIQFYKQDDLNLNKVELVLAIISAPLYPISFIILKNRLNGDLKSNCL